MVGTETVIIKLSELVDGQEATCFAALVKKTKGMTKSNQPYLKCLFRDKRVSIEAPLWSETILTWKAGATPSLIKSDTQINQIEKTGNLSERDAHVVLNCPIIKVGK